ncbi:MAG: GDSL-type esterase/lipase family protein [Flavobacterium sp.]|uniref:GDSL-type esterase/lipase family protein n=1 Tax=Flavobacterium sp. TaxID=239 RepID=UPI003BC31A76
MKEKMLMPSIILSITIVLLLCLSFINLESIKFLKLKNVDLLADLKNIPPQKPLQLPRIVVDSNAINGKFVQPTMSTMLIDYGVDSSASITNFFTKLDQIKSGNTKMRIAYFGDSFIEADYVTNELRKIFQGTYGGNGIGFMPVQSIAEQGYNNINFRSHNWVDKNFVNSETNPILGLTGHVFYSNGTATTQYSLQKGENFNVLKIYTGKSKTAEPFVTVGLDNVSQVIPLSDSNLVNETIISNRPIHDLKLTSANSQLPIYGISIEDTSGIYLDNYGFRGNTGVLTNRISLDIIKQFNQYLNYDLIIIHYGLNAVSHGDQKFNWFENSQNKLIQKIKTAIPNTPILLVSVSDIGYNQNGTWVTEPAVPYMVSTQRNIAKRNKIAYWDLYSSMGGEGTIVKWAQSKPKLAEMDYIHLNASGTKIIAKLFYDKLIEAKLFYSKNKIK